MRTGKWHYGWVIVGAGAMTVFSCLGLARFAYGMLLPSMGKALGLDYDRMGYVGTGNFAGYLAAVAMAPVFMKRWGGRRTITAGLALVAVGMVMIGRAGAFLPVLLLYAATGVGSGLANVPMMVVVSRWFGRAQRGSATGIMLGGNGVAIIFAGVLVPALNGAYGEDAGWRAGWTILGALSALIAAAAWRLLRDSPAEAGTVPIGESETAPPAGPLPGVHAPRIVAHLGILYFLFGATYMIYGTFIVTSMVAERGIAEVLAGRFWAVIGFLGLFSGPLFGALSDRIGRKRGFMAVFLLQSVTYLLAALPGGNGALYLSVVLYGLTAWAVPTIMGPAVMDYLGSARAAAGFSAVTFFFAAGQTVGPAVAGIVAKQAGTFATSYRVAAAATAAAALCALFLKRPPAANIPSRVRSPGAE